MKNMTSSKFKIQCLTVIDAVHNTREPVVITKREKSIAKLVPAGKIGVNLIGHLEGIIKITGDIESPIRY